MTGKKDFLVSIVVPVYNEVESIEPLLGGLEEALAGYTYEVVFVDDGSADETTHIIESKAKGKTYIKLVSFQRNFGHQMALSAGYQHTQGDCVISIDADLQDPPELIPEMIAKWQEGYQIVYARRTSREEGFFKTITAHLFYRLMSLLSPTPIPDDVGDFRLLDRHVVDMLNTMPERSRFLRGLVAWGGYKEGYVTFTRKKRAVGTTHYPLTRMISFALDGIISFSTKPLRIASYIGFLSSVVGFVGIVYALALRLFFSHQYWVTGWTALFVAVMFFGGIQLITIGIIGEYIGKIYKEVQGRPPYLIKSKVNL